MKFRLDPFDKYFASARETEKELLKAKSPLVTALRSYHDFFTEHLFTDKNFMSPLQGLLGLHAFMIYLCSIRVAISGHEAATFPLFRTALEASCYAFLVGETPELQGVWLERNSSEEALKLCRKNFNSAVKDAAKKIQEKSWIAPNTEDWINQAYDAVIDFGAHPNQKAILPYIQINEDRPDAYVGITLGGLYGATSLETSRSLLACLDYGLLIALILVSCLDEQSKDTIVALHRLNDLKEEIAANIENGLY